MCARTCVTAGCATCCARQSLRPVSYTHLTQQAQEAPAADTIDVTVAIDMPDNGMADSKVVETTIPAGGTAFDALEKSGATVQSEDGEYGKFVTSIDGIENGSQGSSSGWVYTVNDQQVNESCDKCVLAEGDTVTWSFYVG